MSYTKVQELSFGAQSLQANGEEGKKCLCSASCQVCRGEGKVAKSPLAFGGSAKALGLQHSEWAEARAAEGIPKNLVSGDGQQPSPSQGAQSVSCCCWIAEGSEMPLDPAPLELLQQAGRPAGGLEGTGQWEAMKGCSAARACQGKGVGRHEGDVCGGGWQEAVTAQEDLCGWGSGKP